MSVICGVVVNVEVPVEVDGYMIHIMEAGLES